jgi:hypothetical protein
MQGVFFAVAAEFGHFQLFFGHGFGLFGKMVYILAHRAGHF